jgi:HEAT repeat protein
MKRMNWTRLAVGLVLGAPAMASAEDLAALRAEVRDKAEAKAVDAARKLAEDTSAQALEVILDELAIGAPTRVQAELLAGLGGRKDPRAFDTLVHYTTNRNVTLRKKAVVAIGELADAKVTPILVAALSDTATDVRSAAARALANRKEKAPVVEEALIKLLAHKDEAAVGALGAIGGPITARKLGELGGQIPDGLLANTFAELLRREDFGPDPLRVECIKAVGKLTGPEATQTLKDYVAATDKDKERPSRKEALKLIELRGAQQ